MHMKSQLCQREAFKRSEFLYPGIIPWGFYSSYLFIYLFIHLFIFPEIFAAAKWKATDILLISLWNIAADSAEN